MEEDLVKRHSGNNRLISAQIMCEALLVWVFKNAGLWYNKSDI